MASPIGLFSDVLFAASAKLGAFDAADADTICHGDRETATKIVFNTLAQCALSIESRYSIKVVEDLSALACLWATRAGGMPLLAWLLTLPQPVQPLFDPEQTETWEFESKRCRCHKNLIFAACNGGVEEIIRWVFALPATHALAVKSDSGKLKRAYAALVRTAPLALIRDMYALLPERTRRFTEPLFTELFQRVDAESMAILDWLLAVRTETDTVFMQECYEGVEIVCAAIIASDEPEKESLSLDRLQRFIDAVHMSDTMHRNVANRIAQSGSRALVSFWLDRVPRPESSLPPEYLGSEFFAWAVTSNNLDFLQWLRATYCSTLAIGKRHPVNILLTHFTWCPGLDWLLDLPGVADHITLRALKQAANPANPARMLERIVDIVGDRVPLSTYAQDILANVLTQATLITPLVHFNLDFMKRLVDAASWGDERTPRTVYSTARADGLEAALMRVSGKASRHPQLIEFFAQQLAAEVALFGNARRADASDAEVDTDVESDSDEADSDADTPPRKRRCGNNKSDDESD
jgi:hypothetical protein